MSFFFINKTYFINKQIKEVKQYIQGFSRAIFCISVVIPTLANNFFKGKVHGKNNLALKCSTKCTDMTSWAHFSRGIIYLEQWSFR